MPEFLQLLPPDEARELFLSSLPSLVIRSEKVETASSLDRVTSHPIFAPHSLPEFVRSTVDGFAVRARDTFGASDSQPGYLTMIGEVPMGERADFHLQTGQCCLIHTGGMLPFDADAVLMLENAQFTFSGKPVDPGDGIEILRAVAPGENVIQIGEDVISRQMIIPAGRKIRPAEMGGLMALGITSVDVAKYPKVGLISSGDELCDPQVSPNPGQVRDINSYTLGALVARSGGQPIFYGIVSDLKEELLSTAKKAHAECDLVVITAGSSASARDHTAEVINKLGIPGVLVHGINTRPGKPTILGICDGKAVIGLPGNPVSALVNGNLFVTPTIEKFIGATARPRATIVARLSVNVPSQAGREDWIPVRLLPLVDTSSRLSVYYQADPIFGKSNLIFNLADADGLLRIPPDVTGVEAGEHCEIILLQ